MNYAQLMQQGIANPCHSMANGGGGDSGGGSSTTVQNIPTELKPLATKYTQDAINLSNQSYTPYTAQRYADMNDAQYQGLGMVADRAMNGSDVIDAGSNYLTNTMNGYNNPSAMSNGYMGATTQGIGYNPYQNAQTQVGANAYSGKNAFLEGAINKSLDDVQTRVNSQFGGNNYGSTAHQETLTRGLGDTENAMRMQDYATQQGLSENALNRSVNAQQTDLARNSQLYQDTNQFNANLRASDLARNSSLYDSYANRDLQAWQLGNNAQQSAAQLAPTYGNQAYTDASQMLNAGQILQDQNQQGLDFNYEQFQNQQDDPYKRLAAMSGVFGSNLGGSSTTTQSGGGGGK